MWRGKFGCPFHPLCMVYDKVVTNHFQEDAFELINFLCSQAGYLRPCPIGIRAVLEELGSYHNSSKKHASSTK